MPSAGTPTAEILDFYDTRGARIVIGGSISLFAIALFVLFAAAVRQVLDQAEAGDPWTATSFAGAVLTAATGISAESLNVVAATRSLDGELDEPLAQALFEISQNFGATAFGLGIAIFATATGVAGLRSGALTPWRSWLVLITGIVLFTPLASINVVPGALLIFIALTIAVDLRQRPAADSLRVG
jgi:hypothetical protein